MVVHFTPEWVVQFCRNNHGLNCICTNSSGQIVITGSAQDAGECQDMCSAYGAGSVYMEQ